MAKAKVQASNDAGQKRKALYAAQRLREIRSEIQTLKNEYKAQPALSSFTDAGAKRGAFKRRAYVTERIAALNSEWASLRSERTATPKK